MRYTPENITELKPNEVFVYGANELYRHGAGAAKQALKWGAKHGMAGLQGQTFGICTKDWNIETLSLGSIGHNIGRFLAFAKTRPDLTFLVTLIGCGLANLNPKDLIPHWVAWGKIPDNVILPKEFHVEYLYTLPDKDGKPQNLIDWI